MHSQRLRAVHADELGDKSRARREPTRTVKLPGMDVAISHC
jgi:hypothetical protein